MGDWEFKYKFEAKLILANRFYLQTEMRTTWGIGVFVIIIILSAYLNVVSDTEEDFFLLI